MNRKRFGCYFENLQLRAGCAKKCIHEYSRIDSKTVRNTNSDAIPRVELAEEAVRIAEKEIRI